MAIGSANRNRGFWFGTERRMDWFPTPNRGADMSPSGWGESGELLNGGGYVFSSFGSHKNYSFEWPSSSRTEFAQLMKAYADGTYGRGLIYFQDCLMFETNVLPARVADPSMAIGYEGSTLVYGVQPSGVPQVSGPNNLPITAARYNLNTVQPGFRKGAGGVFIPIPEGYTLLLGAFYAHSGTGGVFYTPQNLQGNLGTAVRADSLPDTADTLVSSIIPWSPSVAGVWVWVGKSSSGEAAVTLKALSGRLARTEAPFLEKLSVAKGPWLPGQGHSGCKFEGKPTFVANGPVNGGQIGFAATFREVGSWANG